MYIGDYGSKPIYVAAIAAKALEKIGRGAIGALAALVGAWRHGAAVPELRSAARDAVLAVTRRASPAEDVANALVEVARDDEANGRGWPWKQGGARCDRTYRTPMPGHARPRVDERAPTRRSRTHPSPPRAAEFFADQLFSSSGFRGAR
jgi:hypothetical protein